MMKRSLIAALLGTILLSSNDASAQTAPGRGEGKLAPSVLQAQARILQAQDNAVLPNQAMRVGQVERRDIYTPRGERLGSVRRIVLNVTDGRTFLVLERGGLVGLGDKEFPLPVDRVYVQGGRLVVPGLTEAELEAVADWDVNDHKYRELADSEIINVSRR